MDNSPAAARQMWALFEPVHMVTYFTPAARAAFEQAGLRGFWRGYFAGRAAPMGTVAAPPVVAAFFVFAPAMVSRALPSVWDLATPADVLAARQAGATAGLRELLGLPAGAPAPADLAAAADELAAAAADLEAGGRALAAANLALPVPDEPVARLWHAATILREHRGDGHIAALVAADLTGAEALMLRVGVDAATAGNHSHVTAAWPRAQMQPARGWTDEELDHAVTRLADRGLVDASGVATPAGVALHRDIESATDRAGARPWAALGADRTAELTRLLQPVASASAALLPSPNPVGVPVPAGAPAV
jgi:hypothetical protein